MTEPLEREEDALRLPEVAAAYEAARRTNHPGVFTEAGRGILAAALEGLELGSYERRILLSWLPEFGPQYCAVVAAVVRRAREVGKADRDG